MTIQEINKTVKGIAEVLGFTEIRRSCDFWALYSYEGKNSRGETLMVELCYNNTEKFAKLWQKSGYTKKYTPEWWGVRCYVTDVDGACFEAYNPTIKLSDDGHRFVINFDWHLEATPNNAEVLLKEVIKRFMQ